ncbi:MAG: flagellar assembly protein FliW [Firmicutes bacterium]|nr:flagellar assembly protein FliW [Bacillota bacterium]
MTAKITLQMDPPLLGFEEINTYILTPVEDNPYFFWLEAEDGPKFLLTKPEYFFPDYLQQVKSFCMSNRAKKEEHAAEEEPDVYVIITLADKMEEITANLLAPLFVYRQKRQAAQIVLYDSDFTTRHLLFPPAEHRSCG